MFQRRSILWDIAKTLYEKRIGIGNLIYYLLDNVIDKQTMIVLDYFKYNLHVFFLNRYI